MITKLTGGRIYDPAHGIDGEIHDIYVRDGRIVDAPVDGKINEEIDLRGKVVMAGAIDMHTHIGGGKINIARTMLPEDHAADVVARTELMRSGCGHAAPSTLTAGYRYAEMGYTAGFEPAILPINARQAHMEMGDTPIIDKGGYAMLGSDDYLLRMMAANNDQEAINNYVAWIINHMGVCFVPSGVGIINHFELIQQHGLTIVAIIFFTTFLLLTLVGLWFERFFPNKSLSNKNIDNKGVSKIGGVQ